jgi:hypothetical protein
VLGVAVLQGRSSISIVTATRLIAANRKAPISFLLQQCGGFGFVGADSGCASTRARRRRYRDSAPIPIA